MKKVLYSLILGLSLISCKENTSVEADNSSTITDSTAEHLFPANITVVDPTLYGTKFLEGIKEYGGKLKLDGNKILIGDDAEYSDFPQILDDKKTYVFEGSSDGTDYKLTLSKINITDLQFELKANGGNIIIQKGTFSLTPMFFVGAESFEVGDVSILGVDYKEVIYGKHYDITLSDELKEEGYLYLKLSLYADHHDRFSSVVLKSKL